MTGSDAPASTWLVTGAGRGLGLQLARAVLAGRDNVIIAAQDVSTVPADVFEAPGAHTVAIDVTDPTSVAAAVASGVERFATIDVLVNNAGRGLMGAIEEITDREARAVFDVNLFGLLNVTREVLPVMRSAGLGTIVNISSLAGLIGLGGSGVYGATKAAVITVTEALAEEVRPFGIRCMVAEPGVFRTDFLDSSSLRLAGERLDAYDGTAAHARVDGVAERNHKQQGDPARGAALIYDVVRSADLPLHLPLGRDALAVVEEKATRLTDDAERWRTRSVQTAFAEGGAR